MWKITRGDDTVFIGGTMHVLTPADYPLSEAYSAAYESASTIYFEVDLGETEKAKFQKQVQTLFSYPSGEQLQDKLTPNVWRDFRLFLQKRGLGADAFLQMRPGAVMTFLLADELRKLGATAQGVDRHFYGKAKKDGKRIEALETTLQQIQLIASLGEGDEDAFVRFLMEDLENYEHQFDVLREAWQHGDTALLARVTRLDELRRTAPRAYDALIADRNRSWLVTIRKMFETPEVELFLVGALHLVGDDGLLHVLSSEGYRLEQLTRH